MGYSNLAVGAGGGNLEVKTDNAGLRSKLALRRYFLDRYHTDEPITVLDCCQASGRIWNRLRARYEIASYWGVDKEPKRGRLRIESERILAQPGWPQNVVDIDTYGSPWNHWGELIKTCDHPTTVFLTIGYTYAGTIDNSILAALGIKFETLRIPNGIAARLRKYSFDYNVFAALNHGLEIVEIIEAPTPKADGKYQGRTRYVGLRIQPLKISRRRKVVA